jgi:hypothetical protein
MKPNESILRAHLEGPAFAAGAEAGKWGSLGALDTINLTVPVFWVRSDKRIVAAGRIHLKFNTENYPQVAPTACPWDVSSNSILAPSSWPRGPQASTVFNPTWKSDALYAPCDRVAMQGHDAWKNLCPQWWWVPTFTIVRYLEFVYVCLNPADYEN